MVTASLSLPLDPMKISWLLKALGIAFVVFLFLAGVSGRQEPQEGLVTPGWHIFSMYQVLQSFHELLLLIVAVSFGSHAPLRRQRPWVLQPSGISLPSLARAGAVPFLNRTWMLQICSRREAGRIVVVGTVMVGRSQVRPEQDGENKKAGPSERWDPGRCLTLCQLLWIWFSSV